MPVRGASRHQNRHARASRGWPEGPSIATPFRVGKYLVSPTTRPRDGGRHAAAVSIRSGAGSMTHDRVIRFAPDFDTPDQATRFATEQALAWIDRHAGRTDSPTPTTQE